MLSIGLPAESRPTGAPSSAHGANLREWGFPALIRIPRMNPPATALPVDMGGFRFHHRLLAVGDGVGRRRVFNSGPSGRHLTGAAQ